jgi:hypothetical protein
MVFLIVDRSHPVNREVTVTTILQAMDPKKAILKLS